MLTTDDLSALRASLEADRDSLRRQIAEMSGDDFDENFADSGQVAAEQGEHRTLSGTMVDQLAEVEHALAKMDDGTFGTCEVGGEPIPQARIEAVPTARSCITHA